MTLLRELFDPRANDVAPFFIFEIANNHQGSVDHGLRIIDEMARICRTFRVRGGVKFQYRDLETFIHPSADSATNKHISRFKSTALQKPQYEVLMEAVRELGLVTVCTPFDEPSVQDCVNHGVEILKVASCSANDWPLLERIVAARKPIICSTGGLRLDEIDQVVTFFRHRDVRDLAILHCVGVYPTPSSMLQMNFLDKLRRRYHWMPIGYSGHESPDDLLPATVAVAKGSRILERHVGIASPDAPLNAYSMNPEQTAAWVKGSLTAFEACGNPRGEKHITQVEIDSLNSLRRGVFARDDLSEGRQLEPGDVVFAFPGQPGQTTTSEWMDGLATSRAYRAGEPLRERRKANPAATVRATIREAKGMLYEARIELGDRFTVEMSHHYGREQFRSWGAFIISLVNREYCKKLLLMLPGQRHPKHRHHKKEETFQLLHGDLQVNLDGKICDLMPGQLFLVERDTFHSFETKGGAIFEEISTTHIVGDSEYEDPAIARLDPMDRKTVLSQW
jgi:sialic acid synthase SpsE/mannose-6-phosphate isomerase-like protein (cupin superfamily)